MLHSHKVEAVGGQIGAHQNVPFAFVELLECLLSLGCQSAPVHADCPANFECKKLEILKFYSFLSIKRKF